MSDASEPFLDIGPRPWSAPELPGSDLGGLTRAPSEDPVQRAIASAQAEAAALLEAARAEAEQIRHRAREQGLAEAAAALVRDRERFAAEQNAAIVEINAERERFYRDAEPELLKLSFAVAEKIIGREVAERPELVLELIRRSLKRIKDKSALRIRVNPDDLQLVKEARAELLASVDGVEKIEVSDDRRVARGGCIIESPNGTLDARVATQLRELERSMGKVAPHEPQHDGD